MKGMLEGLVAVHDGAKPYVGSYKSTPPEGGYPKTEHPVIATHPETGKKLLYVNSGFTTHIKGLKPFESRALLEFLYAHIATTPKLTVSPPATLPRPPNHVAFGASSMSGDSAFRMMRSRRT